MTDVTKVGGLNPQLVNRPAPPPKDASKAGATDESAKSEQAQGPAATFRLPKIFAGDETGEVSAEQALNTVFEGLSQAFADAEENPPASGAALEALLSDIKVAAPFLDRLIAARKNELATAGDTEGQKALEDTLAQAEVAVTEAQKKLEALSDGLPDEEPAEDPAVTAALNAILGADREIPAFSADELREGRKEFVSMVFEDIADAIGRHRATDVQAAAYTLSALGGTSISA